MIKQAGTVNERLTKKAGAEVPAEYATGRRIKTVSREEDHVLHHQHL